MSPNNHEMVCAVFPHTIAVTEIEHARAAYDLIKWCIDYCSAGWNKQFVNGIVYIQMERASDLTLFCLVWNEDPRIRYTLIDIVSDLGL